MPFLPGPICGPRCDIWAGQSPSLVAEADGNRTLLARLSARPVLKFGDGRFAGCYLVVSGATASRSAEPFMPSGAFQ
jgi:hypothetical protein